ncbi:MAG TPA: hypothetical protein VLG74_02480 [Blastocatellia bacterium]|jgi:hypothetical protein|nr:hypothetical protein [Blastocatellia bacterium]
MMVSLVLRGAAIKMKFLEEFLIRISQDPVQYALRLVFVLGVLLLVLLAIMHEAH